MGRNEPWKWEKVGICGVLHRIFGIVSTVCLIGRRWGIEYYRCYGRRYPYAGPGHWNDAEMLEVGNGGMSKDEYISLLNGLCWLRLMAGNDLRK